MYAKIINGELKEVNENSRGFYNDNDYIMLGTNRIETIKGLGYKPIEYLEGEPHLEEQADKIIVYYKAEALEV